MLSRLKRDLTMADAARAPGGARVDLLLVADMVTPGARVLDVGCGDGELLRLLGETARRRWPRHRAVARGRERMRRQGPRGDPGRRRHRPRRLSERCLRLRHPVADAAGDAPAARRARAHAADRPARDRVVPEFRPLEDPPAARARRPHAAAPTICPMPGGTRPTSISAPSRISASSATSPAPRWSARSRSTPGARRCASMRRGGSGICSASRRCFC